MTHTKFFLPLLLLIPMFTRAAEFPAVYNSEKDTNAIPPTPQESISQLKLPPGFKATVFAAEPDV